MNIWLRVRYILCGRFEERGFNDGVVLGESFAAEKYEYRIAELEEELAFLKRSPVTFRPRVEARTLH